MKQKHLSFEERIVIEEYLNKGESIHKIALKLNRPDSSIVREVKRNRFVFKTPEMSGCEFMWEKTKCQKRFLSSECSYVIKTGKNCYNHTCCGCNIMCNANNCPDFRQHVCSNLQKSPFVCNGCKSTTHCRNRFTAKYKYQARRAQVIYEDTLKESRTGISLSEEQMQALDNLVSPLLFQGQSIKAIYNEKFYWPISEL